LPPASGSQVASWNRLSSRERSAWAPFSRFVAWVEQGRGSVMPGRGGFSAWSSVPGPRASRAGAAPNGPASSGGRAVPPASTPPSIHSVRGPSASGPGSRCSPGVPQARLPRAEAAGRWVR
jgi:hypothetical protein